MKETIHINITKEDHDFLKYVAGREMRDEDEFLENFFRLAMMPYRKQFYREYLENKNGRKRY